VTIKLAEKLLPSQPREVEALRIRVQEAVQRDAACPLAQVS
jgi:hypothetical protein